ncbi:MAG TPA: alpha/beta hydrolase [Mycobacteriales bacterium]|jgi:pimeloyl-ACP methyl ester carboxylesterase|nr:alpha/beta hydrolase [Mycobacteriales bacterium]
MSTFGYLTGDGTRVRGWCNDGTGPDVVVANGLGAPPESWPTLVSADSGYRVHTWYYRGSGGSERPLDPARIRIEDHVGDLLGLLDARGIDRAVLVCWSLGVNVAFAFAEAYPERVAGLLAVAGVPGGSFAAMFGPLRGLPRVRHAAAVSVARGLRLAAPALNLTARTVPVNRATAWAVAHSGFMLPAATPERLVPTLDEFRKHDFRWYFTLAVALADHAPMDLSFVRCPTTLVAGRRDIVTSRHAMRRAAAAIPHARLVELDGSHFLPIERPDELTALLAELVAETR